MADRDGPPLHPDPQQRVAVRMDAMKGSALHGWGAVGLLGLAAACASSETGPSVPAALSAGVQVPVRVVDTLGRPVRGARVRAWAWDEDGGGPLRDLEAHERNFEGTLLREPRCAGTTDGSGEVLLGGLPEGFCTVGVDAPAFALEAREGEALVEGARRAPLEFVLVRGNGLGGTVRDPSGRAMAGASVLVRGAGSPWRRGSSPLLSATRTDAEGRWHVEGLAAGPAHVSVVPVWPGAVQPMVVAVPGVSGFETVVLGGRRIEGTVIDAESRAPVAGASVHYHAHSHSGEGSMEGTATSDGQGRFAVDEIPGIECGNLTVSHADYPGRAERDEAHPGVWLLHRGRDWTASVRGRVLDPDGAPVAGGRGAGKFWAEDCGASCMTTTTYPAGAFAFEGRRGGRFILRAAAPGLFTPEVPDDFGRVEPLAPGLDEHRRLTRIFDDGESVSMDFALARGVMPAGRVLDPGGRPVEGATVTVAGKRWGPGAATGADGTFTLPPLRPDAPFRLEATAPGLGTGRSRIVLPAEAREGVPVDIRLPPARNVRGIVRRADGVAVPGGRVRVLEGNVPLDGERVEVSNYRHPYPWEWDGPYARCPAFPVGPDGRFEVRLEAAHAWFRLAAEHEGHPLSFGPVLDGGEATPGEDVDLVLRDAVEIQGRVLSSADGKPLAGADIDLDDGSAREWGDGESRRLAARTDGAGGFVIHGVSALPARLRVRAPGFQPAEATVNVPDGGEILIEAKPASVLSKAEEGAAPTAEPGTDGAGPAEGKTTDVPKRGSLLISGCVVDARGRGVHRVTVHGESERKGPNSFGKYVMTKDGAFTFTGVPEGTYRVSVGAYDSVAHEVVVEGVGAGTADLVLAVELFPAIEGRVLDDAGIPVPGACVNASPDVEGKNRRRGDFTYAAPDGSFRLLLDPETTYSLIAQEYFGKERFHDVIDRYGIPLKGVKPGGAPVTVLMRRGASISGRVLDEEGEPVPDLEVTVQEVRVESLWERGGEWGKAPTELMAKVDTDSFGGFVATGLDPDGVYEAWAGSNGTGWIMNVVKGLRPGGTEVRLIMSRGRPIRGRVVDGEGRPVPGLRVLPAGSFGRGGFSDLRGEFVLPGIGEDEPADISVNIQTGEDWAGEPVRGVAPGAEGVVLRARRTESIVGIVLDSVGDPVPHASVEATAKGWSPLSWSASDPAGIRGKATSGPDGRFTIPGLDPARPFHVEAWSWTPLRPRWKFDGVRCGAEELRIRFPASHILDGILLTAAGDPAPGFSLGAAPPGSEPFAYGATGEDGRFRLEALPPGEVDVYLYRRDQPLGRFKVGGERIVVRLPGALPPAK